MKQIATTAEICLDDELGFTYSVAKIEYLLQDDDHFFYTFTPNYSVIDLLPSQLFQGIPGLAIELRKPQYVRENVTPVFISERTPAENREDLWQLLQDCGMDYLNRLEWLIRTNTRYSGDRLYVKRWQAGDEKQVVSYADLERKETRSAVTMQRLLRVICAGHDVQSADFTIDDSNRKAFYALLMSLYRKEKGYIDRQRANGIRKSAAQGHYRGRQPEPIEDTRLNEIVLAYRKGKLNAQEASAALNISRSTFFRRIKGIQPPA